MAILLTHLAREPESQRYIPVWPYNASNNLLGETVFHEWTQVHGELSNLSPTMTFPYIVAYKDLVM
jgi:hypothetical protein